MSAYFGATTGKLATPPLAMARECTRALSHNKAASFERPTCIRWGMLRRNESQNAHLIRPQREEDMNAAIPV